MSREAQTPPEDRLLRLLERLRSSSPADFDQDIQKFARCEVEVEDPLRADFSESSRIPPRRGAGL
jgi:hypothetical protein